MHGRTCFICHFYHCYVNNLRYIISCWTTINVSRTWHSLVSTNLAMSEQQAFVDDRVTYSVIKQVENSAVENTPCSENRREAKASNIPIYTMVDTPKKAKQTLNPIPSATDASTGMCDDVITGAKVNSVVDTSKKREQTINSTDTSAVMYDVPTGNLTKKREEIASNDTYSSLAFHHNYTPTKDGPKKEQHHIITSTGIFRILTLACFLIFFITVAAAFAILFSQLNALKHTVNNIDCDKDNVSETLELLTSIKEINSIKKLVENMQLHQHNKSNNYYQYQQNGTTENDILLLQNLFSIFVSLGRNASFPAPSCYFILHHNNPLPSSGFYWIGSFGAARNVFCTMSYCEGSISGWKRVAILDMTNNNVSCPLNLTRINFDGNIYCGLQNSNHSCSSVYFPINTTYSNVSGTVRGYGNGTLDGFNRDNVDGVYLDGVSLTYKEQESRTHIWSFVARAFCKIDIPCPRNLPSFVNTSFTCDITLNDTTLWDDNPCGLTTSPWFFKQLPEPTTSDIEMRLCLDGEDTNENIWISYIELYIQ